MQSSLQPLLVHPVTHVWRVAHRGEDYAVCAAHSLLGVDAGHHFAPRQAVWRHLQVFDFKVAASFLTHPTPALDIAVAKLGESGRLRALALTSRDVAPPQHARFLHTRRFDHAGRRLGLDALRVDALAADITPYTPELHCVWGVGFPGFSGAAAIAWNGMLGDDPTLAGIFVGMADAALPAKLFRGAPLPVGRADAGTTDAPGPLAARARRFLGITALVAEVAALRATVLTKHDVTWLLRATRRQWGLVASVRAIVAVLDDPGSERITDAVGRAASIEAQRYLQHFAAAHEDDPDANAEQLEWDSDGCSPP